MAQVRVLARHHAACTSLPSCHVGLGRARLPGVLVHAGRQTHTLSFWVLIKHPKLISGLTRAKADVSEGLETASAWRPRRKQPSAMLGRQPRAQTAA